MDRAHRFDINLLDKTFAKTFMVRSKYRVVFICRLMDVDVRTWKRTARNSCFQLENLRRKSIPGVMWT